MFTLRVAFLWLLACVLFAASALAQLVPPPPADPALPPAPRPAPVAAPEVRAVRLSLSSGDALASSAKTADTMRRLRDAGVNTVYISAWNNGYTLFPSAVLRKAVGVDRDPSLPEIAIHATPANVKSDPKRREYRDPLAEAVLEAHRQGLAAVAWFEGGLLASGKGAESHLKRLHPAWLARDASGKAEGPDGISWLSPLHPEVTQFFGDLVLEALEKYDLDGIQLDERMTWPSPSMGYEEAARKAFAEEHFGQDPPADATNPAWIKWRAEKGSAMVARLAGLVRQSRPEVVVSWSSALSSESTARDLAPWGLWSKSAHEVALRGDSLAASDWATAWNSARTVLVDRAQWGLVVIGVQGDTSWDGVKSQLDFARESQAGGHILDLRGVNFDVLEKPLTAYYAIAEQGRAAHPKFAPDRRPAPVKLRLNPFLGPMDSKIWRVTNPVPGDYLVTGLLNGERRVLTGLRMTTSTPRKAYEVATPKVYEDVEILPDRRPPKTPAPK